MSHSFRVFMDASVLKHSIRSRTRLLPHHQGPYGHIVYHIAEEDPASGKDQSLLKEIELLPQVAELARSGKIELLRHIEVEVELFGILLGPGRTASAFDGVEITKVKGPISYSRVITGFPPFSEKTWRSVQIEFLKGLNHPRFLQLQKACGAYQGPGRVASNQLVDAFHVWCAETAGATHFLTDDFKLVEHVRNHREWPPSVRLVKPSELLSEVEAQVAPARNV